MKVLILGGTGMLGSSLLRVASEGNEEEYSISNPTRSDCDLASLESVKRYFQGRSFDLVINCAGVSGGINFNRENQSMLLVQNSLMLCNLLTALDEYNQTKFININSSCLYPIGSVAPFSEDMIGQGAFEESNIGYASAKSIGFFGTEILGKEANRKWLNVIGGNLYGIGDSIDVHKAHVTSSLFVKLIRARENSLKQLDMYGNGQAIRDWLYVDDFARAIWLLAKTEIVGRINVSSGTGVSIHDLAQLIKGIVSYEGELKWGLPSQNGSPIRILDNQKILKLGWTPGTELLNGLEFIYRDILERLKY